MKKFAMALIASAMVFSGCAANSIVSATQTNTSKPQSVQWAFTRENKGNPDQLLINQINTAKSTLDIAIYSLTKQNIVDAIQNAKKRHVNVRIITDRTEASNKYQKTALLKLFNAGVPIKENTHTGLTHMKVSIIDKSVVTTGSFNYTESASTINDENLVVIHDPTMAKSYSDEFQAMWNDTSNFKWFK